MELFYHVMLLLLMTHTLQTGALPSFLPNVTSFIVFFLCQEVKCLCLVYNNMLDNDYRNVTEFPSGVKTASTEITIYEKTASEVAK